MDFHAENTSLTSTSSRRPRHSARVPDDLAEDILHRMAAMRVRHQANQHECRARKTGSCDHPNHRRDLDYMQEMLSTLGLAQDYPAYTDAEQQTLLKWLGTSATAAADRAA